MEANRQINYGNWVSTKIIVIFLILSILFGVMASLIFAATPESVWASVWLKIPVLILTGLFIICLLYFSYARYLFAPGGGGVQDKILEPLLSRIHVTGPCKVLDIGCGSGVLSIRIARRFTETEVTGIDYWGGAWEYSQLQCEANARAEGVAEQVTFQRASASKLPFADKSFDLVVSNLVFHEVKDGANKPDVIKEAIRVVKKDGSFIFQDLFLIERYYGRIDDLLAVIKEWGVQEVHFIDTSKSVFIPTVLRLPFMVGTIAIIYGVK